MDLLGDIGNEDQLTSAREENKILQAKCKELSVELYALKVENESLKAELEQYRSELAIPTFSSLALGNNNDTDNHVNSNNTNDTTTTSLFVQSGNGIYITEKDCITIPNLHDNSNLLSCSMSKDDVYIATGGADGMVRITQWGAALQTPPPSTTSTNNNWIQTQYSNFISCNNAPVITTSFSNVFPNVVAAGCMDGKVHLVSYKSRSFYNPNNNDFSYSRIRCQHAGSSTILSDHTKYVRTVCWSPNQPLLATSSADGTIHLYNVSQQLSSDNNNDDNDDIAMSTSQDEDDYDEPLPKYNIKHIKSLTLEKPIECMTFMNNDGGSSGGSGSTLICHARDTSYMSLFDLNHDSVKETRMNLNQGSVGSGGFTDHVSFTVMDVCTCPTLSNVVVLGTDASRNIVYDIRCIPSHKQVRNLYGHTNNQYSQPKVQWSCNGQYIYGNTQNDTSICIWDLSTSKIVSSLKQTNGGHTNPIRDLYSSSITDTVVTVSFDKQTKVWFGPQ